MIRCLVVPWLGDWDERIGGRTQPLVTLESKALRIPDSGVCVSDIWHDAMLIRTKPRLSTRVSLKTGLRGLMQHRAPSMGLQDEV
jgi:hypothetical protein